MEPLQGRDRDRQTADDSVDERVARLKERRSTLARHLERIRADRRRSAGPLDPDFAEQAVQRANDEVLDALHSAEHAELERLDRALARAEAGLFGMCDSCGSAIDARRLDTLPDAALCHGCAAQAERA